MKQDERVGGFARLFLNYEVWAKRARADRLKNNISGVVEEIQDLAEQLDMPNRQGSMSERLIGRELLRAQADYYEQYADQERKERELPDQENLRARSLDELEELLSDAWLEESGGAHALGSYRNSRSGITDGLGRKVVFTINTPVSEVWNAFFEARKDDGYKEKSRKLRSSLNFWIAEYGDRPLKDWTHRMAENLRGIFKGLPHDYAQNKKKWGGFAKPSEIAHAFQLEIEQAASEEEKTSLREKRTARKTWNRHLSTLSEFWKWGRLNALTFPTAPNPFEQLFLIVDDEPVSEGGSEERKPWREEEMRALFASPLFTGCRSPRRRYVPGNPVIRDALYWVVLIVAYTGMRREEICQLRVEHLRHHDEKGIWYFNLKAPGLQLKIMKRRGKKNGRRDSGSKRWVTVPDALIQLGIIEALHKGRGPNEQLFPDLYRSKSNGSFGDKLGQKFGTYRKNYDEACRKNGESGHAFIPLYAHLRDLHSFRHSFCTDMINVGVPREHAEEMVGHTSDARASEFSRYDHGRTIEILKADIDKRALPIDIPRLVEAAANSPEVNAALRGVD